MQLTTVGKAIWRGARKAQELEAAGAGDPQVQERLEKLKQVETLRRRGVPWREVQEVVGISRATSYRWRKRLKEEGLSGLRPRSRRPKRTRGKVRWSPEILLAIEGLRKGNPTWGRWPIWLSLRKGGFAVSERTVGRILAHLEARGGWKAWPPSWPGRGGARGGQAPQGPTPRGSREDTRPRRPGTWCRWTPSA